MSAHGARDGRYQPRRKAAAVRSQRRWRAREWCALSMAIGLLAAVTGGIASASPFHRRGAAAFGPGSGMPALPAQNQGGWQFGGAQQQRAQSVQQKAQQLQQAQQSQQQAANVNQNCTLLVPADPLSAQGLAVPYQLVATNPFQGPCHEANPMQSAFVEAAILAPGGQITLYDPLVIDLGTQPAAPPAAAQVPSGATVGIWFGFNGTRLSLSPAAGTDALNQGACVNGSGSTVFGQFAYCNAPAFFLTANAAIAAGSLAIPPLGTASDGLPCPTTRDFSVVDQDQSDNVVTHYLSSGFGLTAQNNAAGRAALPGAVDLANASDNLLLSAFIDPALGCAPFTVPDQSSDNQPSGALPLDELSAAANQQAPVALVPLNDPMAMVNNQTSVSKDDLYRVGVDQPQIGAASSTAAAADVGDAAAYCRNLFAPPAAVPRLFNDQAALRNFASPNAMMAANLFAFLAMRANQSFTNLGCANLLGVPNPVVLRTVGNLVVDALLLPLGQHAPLQDFTAVAPQPAHW